MRTTLELRAIHSHLAIASLVLMTTSCNAFRAAVIQAPNQQEKELSKLRHAEGKFSKAASMIEGELFLHEDFRSADAYCRNIMTFGQDAYADSLWLGIPLMLLGTGSAAASTAWAATSDDKSDAAAGKVALAATSAIVAGIGLIFVGRAGAAATASGDAGLAFVPGTSSKDRWKICLAARAKWLGSNAEAANIANAGSDKKGGDEKEDVEGEGEEGKGEEGKGEEGKGEEGKGEEGKGDDAAGIEQGSYPQPLDSRDSANKGSVPARPPASADPLEGPPVPRPPQ
jgi:hypothetical protein